jgi:hypothetical protein
MDTVNSLQDCRLALDAARLMRAHIAELSGDDPDFIRDTLEGEVDFDGIVRLLLASIGEDEAHVEGLKVYIDDLKARRDRLGRRVETKRALVASALEIAGRRSVETDIATAILKETPPRAVVHEEADIPAAYWKPQAPKLDLAALTRALRDGLAVAGASLSQNGYTVQIRRR